MAEASEVLERAYPDPAATSVDVAEVERFDRLAATWWDPTGPMWPLHRLNEIRVPYILDQIERRLGIPAGGTETLAGLRVLDIGCGAGLLSESLAQRGADVTGIDVSSRNIQIATRHAQAQGLPIRYLELPLERLQAGAFDVVLNMEVVEHVKHLPDFMATACAKVAEDGVMFVATLNRTIRSFVAAIIGAEYLLGWLPRGTHQWRRFVRPAELDVLLQRSGMIVRDQRGVRVNPVGRRYSLVNDLGINYMITASRW